MRRTIATVSLSGTLPEKLEAIAAARFDGIELFENDFVNYKGSAAEVRSMVADLGLTIDLYQPFRDFEGMPEAQYQRSLERAERKFDLMQELDVSMVLCCSNTSPLTIDDPELAAAQLHDLATRAAARNLRVGFEALAWGRKTNLYGQAWEIVRRADHPHLGLILDSFHTLSLKDDPAGIADIPGHKIFFLQMADAPLLSMDVLQWARHYRSFPGQGQFDMATFLEQVLLAGYTGPLSLEIFNDVFRETPNRRIAVDAMRSLLYLESQVRQSLENPASRDDTRENQRQRVLQRIELYSPPALPDIAGLSYIEFAADEASGEAFGKLLLQLGFRRAGKHRSKAVVLYRQGDVNLIVNAQPNSFARRRFDTHGLSVCAIAVRTTDPERAVGRATAMQSKRYDGPVGTSEQQVPAVVSPGGSLVSFVSSALGPNGLYEADFILDEEEDGAPDAGLEHIDHVALGLAVDQLDTWILFSRAVLGLEPGESLELADPFGLVQSRGVANADRSMRLVLNVSPGQRTRTARTVAAGGGVTVHHIALSSHDIFDSVARLRASGTRFVPISPNYYDDLLTRVDIDPGLLAKMRSAGVLFDRSPAGDYLHVYTESINDGLFFEIVQRVNAYDGYGATNAPARMAAQAQKQTQEEGNA
ncbi:4-hydroxyphenylpyruvate dioxygenase [Caballeronia terrestris]|uniref:3-dehydroshikimate dehydratase n=1 Tax=Caballeronia terrestris TaxID=1226301 RepID=A0A158IBL7_9BURK|nr:sugar phosphate isomerase/epimerase and 4-hydroxyphenylpyruvate domain-containing protein [Caballeronia terrestris]SAL53968.1 4-hydroxyphenylpyruvate dioxygenase [Caballeronia terrestris]